MVDFSIFAPKWLPGQKSKIWLHYTTSLSGSQEVVEGVRGAPLILPAPHTREAGETKVPEIWIQVWKSLDCNAQTSVLRRAMEAHRANCYIGSTCGYIYMRTDKVISAS